MRWRACDLIMQLHAEFGISVSDDTIYRAKKGKGQKSRGFGEDPERARDDRDCDEGGLLLGQLADEIGEPAKRKEERACFDHEHAAPKQV